jgi:hypothetical protein
MKRKSNAALAREVKALKARLNQAQRAPQVCVVVAAARWPERSRFDVWWNGRDPSAHMRMNYR